MTNRLRLRLLLLLPALALLARPAPLAAQSGAVEGVAVQADGGEPIPASLVRLLPAGGGAARSTLTDAAGTFRFADVAPGEYRLSMERIGFTAAPSAPFRVGPGETVRQTLRAALRPVELPALSIEDAACYTADRLPRRPDLEALWREARKGAETRRAFQRRFAFRYTLRVSGEAGVALLGRREGEAEQVQTWHPDSLARLEREAAERAAGEGFAQRTSRGLNLQLPNEFELLSEGFLTRYCLEAIEREAAGWAFRFRPVRTRAGISDIRGVLRLEAETFRVREIDFEYLSGGRPWGRALLRYADVATPMGPVRLPVSGRIRGRPVGGLGLVVTGFEGEVELRDHRAFEDVGGG